MKKITENTRMPFGKHKGSKLRDTPNSYLEWCIINLINSDFHEWAVAAKDELKRRKEDNSSIDDLEKQADKILREAGFDPNRVT